MPGGGTHDLVKVVERGIGARVVVACAQRGGAAAGAAAAPRSPRDAAQVDVTGNWVAQITEDWRWRMITPPKGDYASVPLNALGRQIADGWDAAADAAAGEACRAFGAGGIMRLPTRLKIAWADASTLRIETDLGQQVRVLHFDRAAPADTAPSWQGHSVAEWLGVPPPGQPVRRARRADAGSGGRARGRRLATAAGRRRVRRRRRRAAASRWSRRICGPAICARTACRTASDAVVTEYYDRFALFGNDYLQVVTVVADPTYLTTPFVVSNQFKREPDDSKWNPTPCATDAPLGTFQRPAF